MLIGVRRIDREQRQLGYVVVHELHHLVAIEVAHRNRDGREAEQQLGEQDQQDGDIAEG